jgi:hypothetical protein
MVKRFVRSNISLSGRLAEASGLWFSRHAPGRHVNSGSAAILPSLSPSPSPSHICNGIQTCNIKRGIVMVYGLQALSLHSAPYTIAASISQASAMFHDVLQSLHRMPGLYMRLYSQSCTFGTYSLCTDRTEITASSCHCCLSMVQVLVRLYEAVA